jgi:flagellar hook-length control protein FliK
MKAELSPGTAAEFTLGQGVTHGAPSVEQQDAWARQLAAMLSTNAGVVTPALPELIPTAERAPSNGASAHTGAPVTTSADPQNSDAHGDNRLTLTISTEALGEVAIVIDRAEGGVRVVLGVGAQTAEAALLPEKMALTRALTAVGLTVHSVNIVRQTGLGTVPAEPQLARSSSGDSKAKVAHFTEAARARKRSKGIDVLG